MEAGRTLVDVLRHAKASPRRAWEGSDAARPLTDAGWHQAKHLLADLGGGPLSAIYCSPALRCTQTVEGLAGARGIRVVVDERLAGLRTPPLTDGGSPWPAVAWLGARALALVDEAVAQHADGRLVVCSHGDVLAALLAAVAGRDGVPITDVGLAKGARITLAFRHGRCVDAERLPAAPRRPPA